MDVEQVEKKKGQISDVGLLDLRFAKTAEDLAYITSISDVGAILVPEHLTGVLAGIGMSDVGGIVAVPQDCKVNCLTGQISLSGASLASGDPDTILLVVGQGFITGPVTSVGYKEIRAFGQFFAPKEGQDLVSAKLAQMSGQIMYIPSDPRIIMGSDQIGAEFLELLEKRVTLVVMGDLTFEPTATRDLVRAKIDEIVLMGKIVAQKELIPLLQVLTKTKMGEIVVSE